MFTQYKIPPLLKTMISAELALQSRQKAKNRDRIKCIIVVLRKKYIMHCTLGYNPMVLIHNSSFTDDIAAGFYPSFFYGLRLTGPAAGQSGSVMCYVSVPMLSILLVSSQPGRKEDEM